MENNLSPTTPEHLSRRRFLAAGGLASLSACVPTFHIHASDKTGTRLPVIGPEGHRYEVQHDCMTLPYHVWWQETHGVAVDSEGLVYVKHRTKTRTIADSIVVFDCTGRYVRSFGKEFHGGGHGIDIRWEGNQEFLYLSDNKGYIAKSTLLGELVWMKSAPAFEEYADAVPFVATEPGKYGKGRRFVPTNIAFAPDGGFYAADGYGSHFIIHYDKDARPVRIWGGKGSEPGKMKTPHGLWWDDRPGREPALVVTDRANSRLQYFTAEGKHRGFLEGLLFPADVDIRGEVLLVPDLHARVSLFDKDNNLIAHLGDDPRWRARVLDGLKMRGQPKRWEAGKFVHPHDACFDQDGNIYVVEWVPTGRVTFLRHVG